MMEVCDQEQHFLQFPRAPPSISVSFPLSQPQQSTAGPRWAEARDDARPLTVHGVGPATKSYPAQHGNSTEGEKPCYRLM